MKYLLILALLTTVLQSCHMYTAKDCNGRVAHYVGHKAIGNVFIDGNSKMTVIK